MSDPTCLNHWNRHARLGRPGRLRRNGVSWPGRWGATPAATSPDSPVNLATSIDFAAGVAARGATVSAGDARFEVLGDGLIRMEYSPSGNFEDLPTANVLNRRFPVPFYRANVRNGWLTIATSAATLRYRLGSGPFGPSNVTVSFRAPQSTTGGQATTVSPTWPNECPYGQICDAGAAALVGPASIQTDHASYQSVAGFIAGLGQGNSAGANWTVLNAPAGRAKVTLRYSNYLGALGGPAPRTIDLVVNGTDTGPLTLPPTASWDDWSTVTTNVSLTPGTDTVGVLCASGDSCNVNVDTLSVSSVRVGGAVRARHELPGRVHARVRHRYVWTGLYLPHGHANRHAVHRRSSRDAPRPPRPGGLSAPRRHRHRGVDQGRLGRAAAIGRGCRGRLPIRLRRQLQPGAGRPQQADRPLPAARRVQLRRLVLGLLPVHHVRLREHAHPRVPGQRRPSR